MLHQRTVSHTASKDSVYEENTDQCPVNYKITEEWPVYVEFTNGKVYGCDIIVSATGVVPNTQWIKLAGKNEKMLDVPELAEDGGIVVDEEMRSNMTNVYAAGDVCTVNWSAQSATWFPVSGTQYRPSLTTITTHTRTRSHTHTHFLVSQTL